MKDDTPLVSVLISNRNGSKWLPRCFESLRQQTILDRMEVIMVDNCSSDDSVAIARKTLADSPKGLALENPKDLGFTGGNNTGARAARGEYLFITNNDVWLEPDCLERLVAGTKAARANASTPLVLNYQDDSYQDLGFFGFDPFGLPSPSYPQSQSREVFIAGGCAYLIERKLFWRIGGFDEALYFYAEEVEFLVAAVDCGWADCVRARGANPPPRRGRSQSRRRSHGHRIPDERSEAVSDRHGIVF